MMRHASSPPLSGEYIALSAPFLITQGSDCGLNASSWFQLLLQQG